MIREIEINFKEGTVKSWNDGEQRNNMTLLGKPDMDQLIEYASIDTHYDIITRNKSFEEIQEWFSRTECDHPDCKWHPHTWGKTEEELKKEATKSIREELKDVWLSPKSRKELEEDL